MKKYEIKVDDENQERVDSYLAKKLQKVSRTSINKLIKDEFVLVNNKKVKPKYIVKYEDIIDISLPQPKKVELKSENIPLDIIYEDSDILVVNKPIGMVVHPVLGNESGTLVNALLYKLEYLPSHDNELRPGIVHRLDKDTSGLLVVAKTDAAYSSLVKQFKNRTIERIYTALVYGNINIKQSTINAPIGRNPLNRTRMSVREDNSKEAITHYKVIKEFNEYSLIEANLETGRTHQIRVHMSYIKHPIVGDSKYSRKKNDFNIKTQLLHARHLGFLHPNNNEYIEFNAEIPENFKEIIELLEIRNR